MTPKEMSDKLSKLEKAVIHRKDQDTKTKYQVASMFRYLKKLIAYQEPMKPINISDNGHKFECPRCHTAFDSEDTFDQFNGCYICLQRWKEEDTAEDSE